MKRSVIGAMLACATLLASSISWAQEAEGGAAEGTAAEGEGGGTQAEAQVDEAAVADALEGVQEQRDKTYLFLGARYRNVIIPEFVIGLFADGGASLFAHTPGLEFAIRKNDMEYQLFAQLGFYTMEDTPFKGASDDEDAWEIIDANYKILFLGSDFMWSSDEFSPGFSLTYGAGVGLGVVFGDLVREEAYDPNGPPTNVDDLQRCNDVRNPSAFYCTTTDDHFNGYVEPSWADGGSSPLVFPWVSGNFGMRYKAHKNFVLHAELGLMFTGAFLGAGVQYGL